MKKLALLAFVVLGMASCKKGSYELVDVVHNQGEDVAIVNGVALNPDEKINMDHSTDYSIQCIDWQKCKVNINGAIFYKSGNVKNHYQRKQY